MHGLDDVLELLLPPIVASELHFSADFVVYLARDADAARWRQCFETRRHVYPVPVNAASVENHVTEVDADAQVHLAARLDPGVARGEFVLNGNRRPHGLDNARELGQEAVARRIDDAPAELADHRQYDCLLLLEIAYCACFIRAHQGAVARNVCREDGGELACLVFTHERDGSRADLLVRIASLRRCLAAETV